MKLGIQLLLKSFVESEPEVIRKLNDMGWRIYGDWSYQQVDFKVDLVIMVKLLEANK